MSRINVDSAALTDPRFARLAQLLGLADADHARSKMEWLWLDCTERGECTLPTWLVEQRLGTSGVAGLVEAELGRCDARTPLRIYICGSKGRTEWKLRLQRSASKGGKSRVQNASRVAGKLTSQVAGSNTSAPSPSPSPSLTKERESRAIPPNADSVLPSTKTNSLSGFLKGEDGAEWQPLRDLETCALENQKAASGIRVSSVLEKFRDAMVSSGRKSADWTAEWRNYLRREQLDKGNSSKPTPPTKNGTNGRAPRPRDPMPDPVFLDEEEREKSRLIAREFTATLAFKASGSAPTVSLTNERFYDDETDGDGE